MTIYNKPFVPWESEGATPPVGQRVWNPGDKPPADWFNWLFDRVHECFEDAEEEIIKRLITTGGIHSFGAGTLAQRPSPGVANRFFIDTTNRRISRDTGTTWEVIGSVDSIDWANISNVPLADTSQAGIVQLTNAIDSNSELLAVTAKALKTATDNTASIAQGTYAGNQSSAMDTSLRFIDCGFTPMYVFAWRTPFDEGPYADPRWILTSAGAIGISEGVVPIGFYSPIVPNGFNVTNRSGSTGGHQPISLSLNTANRVYHWIAIA